MSLRDDILALFRKYPGELFKTNEISKMLAIKSDSERYQSLRELLNEMEQDGSIERGTRRRYGLPLIQPSEVEGELKLKAGGNGVVKPAKEFELGDTVFISAKTIGTAMDGDYVRVRVFPAKENERPQGEIISVLRKAGHRIIGVLARERRGFYVRPDSGHMHKDVFITRKDLYGAKEGDRVKIELYDWIDEHRDPEGFVLEVLDVANAKEYSMEIIAAEYDLPLAFPDSVLAEANSFSSTIPESEIAKRLDLRDQIIFTIDPEDAKDFDDAVSLVKNDDGTVTLGVHIADVSHYVREGSELDNEALARGTSVYLVGGVIPMLPEKLSNELCSLRPNEDKLAYSVFMRIDPVSGKVLHSDFNKSVIRSVRRFSYEEAEEQTVTGEGDYAELLREMRTLSEKLYEVRRAEGSIDFESTEYRFRFNEQGEPIESYRKDRLGSMRMIEDFMLAANRVVAELIANKASQGTERPFLYRIHADPDPAKLRDLAVLAKTLGYKFSAENPRPKTIQAFLESVKGAPEEHLLNQLMLRAMAKAVYAEHNVGHFGLAFLHYTHFTSPIRRYPDLIVHRMLFEYQRPGGMNREREHYYYEALPDIADQTSALERRATEAERESIKLAQIHLLKNRIGDFFEGVISGVTHFGLFIQLESGAEGLLHIRALPGHYDFDEANYSLVESSGSRFHRGNGEQKRYRIGDKIQVQLVKILEDKRQLDFRLPEELDADGQVISEDSKPTRRTTGPRTTRGASPRGSSARGGSRSGSSGRGSSKSGSSGSARPRKSGSKKSSSRSAGGPPQKGRSPKRRSR